MEKKSNIPTVSIVGRPNVGKSSLFNCLLGERRAVVVEQSGTTRDRVEAMVHMGKRAVKLVDTGGYLAEDSDEISMEVKEQIYGAMEEASIILMVTDSIDGVTPQDKEVAILLRKFSKNVMVVANKTDNERLTNDSYEFYQLGFGDPEAVSCLHRKGIRKLKQHLLESVKELSPEASPEASRALKIAVVGRPNVGKSSFINNILDRKRVIVSEKPGTTRDSIDTYFSYEDDDYILIDTAGIRHKRKVKSVVDTFSMMRSREAIKRADVTVLLIDAKDGMTKDDVGILTFIDGEGKGCIIAVNKWDLADEVDDVTEEEYQKHLEYSTSQIAKYPLSFISAKTGKDVLGCLEMAKVLDTNLDLKVSTPFLNKIFERSDPGKVPVPRRKRRPNFLYIVQKGTRPLEFRYFVSDPKDVLPAHESFIENQLREHLPLSGIPTKISFAKSRKKKPF